MGGLLPVVLIICIFPLSFIMERWLKGRYGAQLALAAASIFVVAALLDSAHRYIYLFFAIVIAGRYLYSRRSASDGVERSGR